MRYRYNELSKMVMSQGGGHLVFLTHPAFDLNLTQSEYDAPDDYFWALIPCPG